MCYFARLLLIVVEYVSLIYRRAVPLSPGRRVSLLSKMFLIFFEYHKQLYVITASSDKLALSMLSVIVCHSAN